MRKKRIAFMIFVSLMAVGSGAIAQTAVPAEAVTRAEQFFQAALMDEKMLPFVLKGLQSTKDPDLLPLFASICKSGDKQHRQMATALIDELAGKASAPVLLERLQRDPSMAVRATALVRLLALEAINPEQLITATKIDDEGIQVIAARALVRANRILEAKPVLKKLSNSRDKDTATLARMSLLAAGDQTQIGYLRRVILDPKTQPAQQIRMVDQIRLEKIASALPVATFLAQPDQMQSVRVRAYMAINELSPKAAQILAGAIRTSDSLAFKLNLLRMLAERDDGGHLVAEFADGPKDDSFAVVARFEQARKIGDEHGSLAASTAIAQEHPIVIEYVLTKMQTDIEKNREKADFYTLPVLAYVRSADLDGRRFTSAHERVALAVQLIGELGSENARKGLWDILSLPDTSTVKQLTAGALYRCKNKQYASLVHPLLKSPFPNLKTYSALLLAKNDNTDALPVLLSIQERTSSNQTDVLTLTNWYLLKLAGQSKETVEKLVKSIE
jgi:hypothetical protein